MLDGKKYGGVLKSIKSSNLGIEIGKEFVCCSI